MKKRIDLIFVMLLMILSAFSFNGCSLLNNGNDKPEGIATTSTVICDLLDKLNCDNVVGVPATGKDLPERYADVKKIGAPMEPQIEILKQVNPEIVLVPKTLEASLSAELSAANINVKYINLSDISEMYKDILELGELFGRQTEAAKLYNDYKEYMDSYPKSDTDITVMTVMAFSSLFTIATEDSYAGNLVKLAGGKNVYGANYVSDGTGVITNYSLEDMAQKDPDVILVFAHFNEEYAFSYIEGLTKSDAVWKNFRAVKNKRIYYLSTADGFGVSANLDWTQALVTLRPIFFGE